MVADNPNQIKSNDEIDIYLILKSLSKGGNYGKWNEILLQKGLLANSAGQVIEERSRQKRLGIILFSYEYNTCIGAQRHGTNQDYH